MTEVVTVIKDKGRSAVIELKRTEKCEGCNRCSFNRRSSVRVNAIKEADCTAGDKVVVRLPEKDILLAPLFLFVIPLAFVAAAVAATRALTAAVQIAVIAAALAAGIAVTYAADRFYRRKRGYMPVIISKYISQGEDTND